MASRCQKYCWRWSLVGLIAGFLVSPVVAYQQAPMLEKKTAAGEIPVLEARLPANPRVVDVAASGRTVGQYGGELRLLMGRAKDVRLMVVYGYSRLVGYDENYKIVPDILEAVDVQEDRIFTMRLRSGHRWSDGEPFTTEDFRFYWEDLVNNKQISPMGIPQKLQVNGEVPEVEIIDKFTVRYSWSAPNPFFLPSLAGTMPLSIYAPAHYLKQFHESYVDKTVLNALVEDSGQHSWAAVLNQKNRSYKNTNPDLPSLQPWIAETRPPAQRFVFTRNPFYHRVDSEGNQLPYIDKVIMNIADGKLIPAKAGAGETDLQARHLGFSDYTFLRQNEDRSGYQVYLWETTKGSHIALLPNLNATDEGFRQLTQDVRFRRALSMAIDRSELNQVLFYGLAVEGNNTVHEMSPLYDERYRIRWTQFDIAHANELLDEIGLTERDNKGIRLLPDGRPLTIIVETAGEDTQQVDALELIHDSWLKVGIKLFTKPLQREVFRNRVYSGETVMSVWGGIENGLPTPQTSPAQIAPTRQDQLQWPRWGQHFETKGAVGDAPTIPEVQELLRLNSEWLVAVNVEARATIWRKMLDIFSDEMFTIGLVAAIKQPVVVNRSLRNVPEHGVYNWEPGAHFGIYSPDTFWFEQ